jgi:hypothetical protein
MANRCLGVMPTKAMFGRSWLYIHHPLCGVHLDLIKVLPLVLGQPFVTHRSVEPLDIGVLLRLARLDVFKVDAPFPGPVLQIVPLMFSGPLSQRITCGLPRQE